MIMLIEELTAMYETMCDDLYDASLRDLKRQRQIMTIRSTASIACADH